MGKNRNERIGDFLTALIFVFVSIPTLIGLALGFALNIHEDWPWSLGYLVLGVLLLLAVMLAGWLFWWALALIGFALQRIGLLRD